MSQSIVVADRPYNATPAGPGDLHGIFNRRAIHHGAKHALQQEMADIYNGIFPSYLLDFFHEEQHIHLLNMIRLAWDDLAQLTAQEFPLYVDPESDSSEAKKRAEKIESICYGYNVAGRKAGAIDMRGLMMVMAHHLVGFAEAVAIVYPDFKRKTPYFTWRDPRTHFAPIGWSPWEQSDLNGTMFAYRMNLAEVKRRFPDAEFALNKAYRKSIFVNGRRSTGWRAGYHMDPDSNGGDDDENRWVWVGEWYSDEAWYISTLEDETVILFGTESGDKGFPDICPVVGYALYNTDSPRSGLADQVPMQAAMSRIFSQRLDYVDKTLYPLIFTTRLASGDKVRFGPHAINIYDETIQQQPRMDVVAPQNPIDADQLMGLITGFMRMLNRNPESMQGGGPADSAKAVNELKSAVSSTVQNGYWPTFFQGHPQLYGKAMRMDINTFGAEKKRISGKTPDIHKTKRGVRVGVTYRATELIGYEDSIEIEPGIALRGYEGRLEIMQLTNSGLLSPDTALEQLDVVKEPQEEKRRIQASELEKAWMADLLFKAQAGQLAPGAWAVLRDAIQSDDEDQYDAMARLEEEGKLYLTPPAPEEMGMPGMEGGGGLPPGGAEAAMAALEGGGAPPLALLQGGM